tara:strand:+ start:863 stop:1132 length:270 start_codon:yes stop_codon:yes gene_type:complete
MSRYRDTKHKKKNGRLVKSTTIYRKVPKSSEDIMVMTTEGDRFDLLASQYYNDPSLWWVIAKANGRSFNTIESGVIIRIPANIDNVGGT